ncbi:chain-length determining protein [Thiosulfatimonas sediminis]|uniref:non-specific protein-tyrosine kinase n=1 Tax=Thiosulfatimonas sediminis TaxID=2675054 RepID=A0A6F8PTC2_9GAMM|nr:polysaccharide biosynthesis tyrosine autokinase [Thiosulfatimonas sediminis]BBP45258.1 chain-length determining protein [Thiosulfatimonas sediminis]
MQNPVSANNPNPLAHIVQSDSTIDVMSILKPLWGYRWRIILFTLLVTALTALFVSTLDPVYKATVKLQIDSKKSQVVSIEQLYSVEQTDDFLNTQYELLKSRDIAERVITDLNLLNHREFSQSQMQAPLFNWKVWLANGLLSQEAKDKFEQQVVSDTPNLNDETPSLDDSQNAFFSAKDEFLLSLITPPKELTETEKLEKAVNRLLAMITVEPIKRSQLVNIHVEMVDPYTAALVANKIAEVYINRQLEMSVEATAQATEWMNGRLVELKQKLNESEQMLQDFKKDKGLIDLDGIVTVSANELSGMNANLINARAELAKIETQYVQVRDMKKEGWEKLTSAPAILSHPLIQGAISEEAKARSNLNELSQRYGAKHPEMRAAAAELDAARTDLEMKVNQIVATIEKQYQAAKANERALASAVWSNKSQIKKIATNEYKLNELKREVETNQALYNTFLTRLKETSATTAEMEVDFRVNVIDKALKPLSPIKPKKSLIVAAAGFLGFAFIVGLIILFRFLNNGFKTSQEVERTLNLPVNGIVPLVKGHSKKHRIANLYSSGDNKAFSEAVNTIRTSVVLSSLGNDYKKIMLTSSIPGEGKTTTALNLAFAVSAMEKTLLIEADMRRPNIAKRLGLPVGSAGLANVLSGSADLETAIYENDGLFVMPAGNVPPNPLELLMNDSFAQMLAVLSEQYERIIIDTPPVQAVSDSLIIGSHVNKVMYVVKSDATAKEVVKKGVGMLLQSGAPVKGIVLNQVDIKRSQREGYYYDGYYDYYGYSK